MFSRKGGNYMKNKFKKALPFMLAASLALGVAPGIGVAVNHTAQAASISINGNDESNTTYYIPGGESSNVTITIGGKDSRFLYPCHKSSGSEDNKIDTGVETIGYYAYIREPNGVISTKVKPNVSSYGSNYSITANIPPLDNGYSTIVAKLPFCKYENCSSTDHPLSERNDHTFTFGLSGVRCQVSSSYILYIDSTGGFTATYDVTGSFPNMTLTSVSGSKPEDLGIDWNISGSQLILKGDTSKVKPDTSYSFRFVSSTSTGMPISIASNTFSLSVAKRPVGNLSNTMTVPADTVITSIDLPKLPKGVKVNNYGHKSISSGISGTFEQNGLYPRLELTSGFRLSAGESKTIEAEFKDNLAYGDFKTTTTVSAKKIDATGLTARKSFSGYPSDLTTVKVADIPALKTYGLFNPDVLDEADRAAFATYLGNNMSLSDITLTTTSGSTFGIKQVNVAGLISGFAATAMPSGMTYGDKYTFPSATEISGTLTVYVPGSFPDFTVLANPTEERITVYPEDGAVSRTLTFNVINNMGYEVSYQWYIDGNPLYPQDYYGVFGSDSSSSITIGDLAAFVISGDVGDDHVIYCKASSSNGQTYTSNELNFSIRYIKDTAGSGGTSWNTGGTSAGGSGGGGSNGVTGGAGGDGGYTSFVTDQNAADRNKNENKPSGTTNTTATITSYQAQYSHPAAGTASKMYRLLSVASGEHLFSTDMAEVKNLLNNGWKSEEIKGKSTAVEKGDPVFRLYNPNTKEHLYSMDLNEKNHLTSKQGWRYEGIVFFSGGNTPLTRLYNSKAVAYNCHLLTSDQNEIKTLMARGWKNEGLSWSLDTDE